MGTTGPVFHELQTGRMPSIVRALLRAKISQSIVPCSELYNCIRPHCFVLRGTERVGRIPTRKRKTEMQASCLQSYSKGNRSWMIELNRI
jgi:hypothetical protein